jgi:hypothetical protein
MNIAAVSTASAQIRPETLVVPPDVRPEDTPIPKTVTDPPLLASVEKGAGARGGTLDVYA